MRVLIRRRWDEFELQRINEGRSWRGDCREWERRVLWEGGGEQEKLEETAKSTRGVEFLLDLVLGHRDHRTRFISIGKQMLCTKCSLPHVKMLPTLTISLTAVAVVVEQSTFVP